jgi:hypothetical protein
MIHAKVTRVVKPADSIQNHFSVAGFRTWAVLGECHMGWAKLKLYMPACVYSA